MRSERRGLPFRTEGTGQPAMGGADVVGEAVQDSEAPGVGSVSPGEGESGSAWCGWGITRDVRVRGKEAVVQDLESNVVGVVFPPAGATRGDRKEGRGQSSPWHSYGGRSGGADSREDGVRADGRAGVPPRLVWLSPRQVRPPSRSEGEAALLSV